MKHLLLILSIIFINQSLPAQDLAENYKWEEKPDYEVNQELAENYSAVILLDYRIKEFYGGFGGKPFKMSNINHLVVKIIDKKAIEKYNRVYVPNYGELTEIKARTIKPDGTIINIDKDKMKAIKDKDYGDYTIFALEGVDEGDIVEYMYKRILERDYCGIEFLQREIPVQEAKFEISSRELYNIDVKVYRGLSDFNNIGKNHLLSRTQNIPALPYEGTISSLNNYKMRAAYRVKNLQTFDDRRLDMITWENIAQDINSFGEVKQIRGYKMFFHELGLEASVRDEDKIMVLEKYFKENFNYKEGRSASSDKFKDILKNKYGNEIDLTRVMKHLLKKLDIHSTWMISTDKNYIKLDPDFPNTQGLREHILYIPSTGKYIAMGYKNMRYGAPPVSVIDNYALVVSDIGRIEKIDYNVSGYTNQKMVAKVTFNDDFTKTIIDKSVTSSGFKAIEIRSALNSGREEIVKSITDDYMTDYMGNTNILGTKIENPRFDDSSRDIPVIVKTNIEATELIEDAEDFYIFSLGKVIGEQNELYQEKERISPIEIDYPLEYFTTIEIIVPEGYTVLGLEDYTIKKDCMGRTENIAGFETTAVQEGNIITIKLYEYYDVTFYPIEIYQDYRAVVNAAADFNQLVLIFERK